MWKPLQAVMEKCWVLWELLILAQPLMVIAPSPGSFCASLLFFHSCCYDIYLQHAKLLRIYTF